MSLEDALLVTREPLYLKKTQGKIEVHKGVPAFLRDGPLVCSLGFKEKYMDCNLTELLPPEELFLTPEQAYGPFPKGILAYWSGRRSCIIEDQQSGRLFRLKGMAFREGKPDVEYKQGITGRVGEPVKIDGGQFLQSAGYEIAFSNRFNRMLKEEGISPVMQYRGMYKYPYDIRSYPLRGEGKPPAHYKMAATLFEIAGDTRVDELFCEIDKEIAKIESIHSFSFSKEQEGMEKCIRELYRSIGFVSGRLKIMMDRNDMTWGDSPQNSNAHQGNIVVYPADKNHLAINFVDFDASCERCEFTPAQLKAQQYFEKTEFTGNSLLKITVAPRAIKAYSADKSLCNLRKYFRTGFKQGYVCSSRKQVSNVVSREPYDELMQRLKMAKEEGKKNKDKESKGYS